MEWIFDNLNVLIIIGVVIASFFKSVMDSKNQKADEPEETTSKRPPVPIDQDKSYRKNPPPVTANIPAPRSGPQPLNYGRPEPVPDVASVAAAEEAAQILKHQQDLAAHLQRLRETKATTTGGAAATRARVASSKSKAPKKPMVSASMSLRTRLKNPAELRRAFVMREILDAPVALR